MKLLEPGIKRLWGPAIVGKLLIRRDIVLEPCAVRPRSGLWSEAMSQAEGDDNDECVGPRRLEGFESGG